jgi:hypothetical protein
MSRVSAGRARKNEVLANISEEPGVNALVVPYD